MMSGPTFDYNQNLYNFAAPCQTRSLIDAIINPVPMVLVPVAQHEPATLIAPVPCAYNIGEYSQVGYKTPSPQVNNIAQ